MLGTFPGEAPYIGISIYTHTVDVITGDIQKAILARIALKFNDEATHNNLPF